MAPVKSVDLFAIRSDDGSLVRLLKTPSGGAAVEAWRDGAWVPVDVAVSDVLPLPAASPAELAAAGVPSDVAA